MSATQKKLVEEVPLRAFKEGLITHKETSWYLPLEPLSQSINEKIRVRQFAFIPETSRYTYAHYFNQIPRLKIATHRRSNADFFICKCGQCGSPNILTITDLQCRECHAAQKIEHLAGLAPWFIQSILALEGMKLSHGDRPDMVLVTDEGTEVKKVACIMALGLQLHGDIPFKEITTYQKRPLQEEQSAPLGADEGRFGVLANPGKYSCGSIPEAAVRQRFPLLANKLWNAARFIFKYTAKHEEHRLAFDSGSDIDKWFAHLLADSIEAVNDLMEQHRVNEALLRLHKDFKNQFCNRYLVLSRINLDHPPSRALARYAMLEFLRLFYPFLPGISQRIYQLLTEDLTPLETTQFPSFNGDMIFPDQFARVELLGKLIRAVKRIRESAGIDAHEDLQVIMASRSQKERKMVERLLPYFNHMTGSRETLVSDQLPRGARGLQGEHLNWQLMIPYEEGERKSVLETRLLGEIDNIEEKITALESALRRQTPAAGKDGPDVKNAKHSLQNLFRRRENVMKWLHDLS